jgi:hypothetical protein
MKSEQLVLAYKAAQDHHGPRPTIAQCVEVFIAMFPGECSLTAAAAIRRAVNKDFRSYFHSQSYLNPDAEQPVMQLALDLPGDPPPAYYIVEGDGPGSFEVVPFEHAARADLESALRYGRRLVGHITAKIANQERQLRYLLTFPGFAEGRLVIGDLQRPDTATA